ncbi:MAG: DUF4440 domain-containing protein [Proteobacteria bacterium]|nr:DUF4440 domain-containing protein [Pseudomonadota bacterium]
MAAGNRLFALVVAFLAAGSAAGCVAMGDPAAVEQAIRNLDKKWAGAVVRGDVATIVDLYAPDSVFFTPNAPPAEGPEAIGEAWKGIMSLPNVSLNFRPTRIDVAASGDLATDIGTYDLAFSGEDGRVRDEGKYVVVWKKINGEWKVLVDILNSNLKAP